MPDPTPKPAAAPGLADDDFIEQMLAEAQASVNEINHAVAGGEGASAASERGIDLLGDVDLDVSIELGRTEMLVEDVLRLQPGSVVELDKLAGDPVDVFVNGRLVARGEVLVLNDNFCIRVSEILADLGEHAEAAAAEQAGDPSVSEADAGAAMPASMGKTAGGTPAKK